MKIIDSHFHIYKSEQAGLMAQGGNSILGYKGVYDEAIPVLERGRICKIMALAVIPIAPMRQAAMEKWPQDITPSNKRELAIELEHKMQTRLSSYNDWLCRRAREDGRIEPVIAADATVDMDYMAGEILAKLETYHVKAIKIHPSVNKLSPAHEGYQRIFQLAEEKNLAIISHGGFTPDDPEGKDCSPENFREVLRMYPKLKLVIAHFAFPNVKGLLELANDYPNFYTDLSFVLGNSLLSDQEICDAIRGFGSDRVLFGSDFPWSDPERDVERLHCLKLKDSELERVAWQNAANIFELSD